MASSASKAEIAPPSRTPWEMLFAKVQRRISTRVVRPAWPLTMTAPPPASDCVGAEVDAFEARALAGPDPHRAAVELGPAAAAEGEPVAQGEVGEHEELLPGGSVEIEDPVEAAAVDRQVGDRRPADRQRVGHLRQVRGEVDDHRQRQREADPIVAGAGRALLVEGIGVGGDDRLAKRAEGVGGVGILIRGDGDRRGARRARRTQRKRDEQGRNAVGTDP